MDAISSSTSSQQGQTRHESLWQVFRRYEGSHVILVFLVVQVLCIVASLLFPSSFRYLSADNFELLMKAIPTLAIVAIGVGILMIAGEFDLSVGSTYALSAYLMAISFNAGTPAPLAIGLALLVGAFLGLLNGLIVIKTRIPSFIATLGMMMFLRGVLLIVSSKQPASFLAGDAIQNLFAGSFLGIQAQFFWLGLAGVCAYLLLERHQFGNHVFATGGNPNTAIAIGVRPDRVKLVCFTIVGFLTALSGVVTTVRVNNITPAEGFGLELMAIAACVVGGLSLNGGVGSIIGIILGAALIHTIRDVTMLLGAPGDLVNMFVGVLIVVAVIFNNMTRGDRS